MLTQDIEKRPQFFCWAIMKVSEALAHALAKEGVEVVFGMLDTVVVALAYGLLQRGIQVISARHEQAAVVMVNGYARVTTDLAYVSSEQARP